MKIEVESEALDTLRQMAEKLQAERDELLEALIYWVPEQEPLLHQFDGPSLRHRGEWMLGRLLIAKCTAKE